MLLCSGDDDRRVFDAIAFQVDVTQWPDSSVEWVEIAYRLDVNEYRGRRSLQLIVEQIEKLQLGQQVRLG